MNTTQKELGEIQKSLVQIIGNLKNASDKLDKGEKRTALLSAETRLIVAVTLVADIAENDDETLVDALDEMDG